LIPFILAGIALFFLDMDHGSGNWVYEVYGFAHLAFFMFLALRMSTLPAIGQRPVLIQFLLIMFAVLVVGGIIELTQPYFGRSRNRDRQIVTAHGRGQRTSNR
jgi:thiol:disulfide interchange protein